MRLFQIGLHPPRCHTLGRRLHHGPVGIVMLRSRHQWVRLLGAVVIASDWHDRRVWLSDLLRHPGAR